MDKYEDHFLFPKFCFQLGRDLWMRAGGKEGAGKERSTDRAEAKRWLGIAASGSGGSQGQSSIWRSKAAMLKSQFEKHGVAWPGNTPPPAKVVPAEAAPGNAGGKKEEGAANNVEAVTEPGKEKSKEPAGKTDPAPVPAPAP